MNTNWKKTFREKFGYENLVGAERERFEHQESFIESLLRKQAEKVGFLRQWLNEDRITDPRKMVTNEEIEFMLGLREYLPEKDKYSFISGKGIPKIIEESVEPDSEKECYCHCHNNHGISPKLAQVVMCRCILNCPHCSPERSKE